MNKKKWVNLVSVYSILYTAITLLNSVLYLFNGVYEDPSGNWHELDRAIILSCLHEKWNNIGFIKDGMLFDIAKGFVLGICCFFAAYSIECFILYKVNQNVSLAFYVSGFALNGETTKHNGILFIFLCIALNIMGFGIGSCR